MIPDCVRHLIHESRRRLGAALARCRLHRICFVEQDGELVVMKSRRFGSAIAIVLGNLYLRFLKSDVEVLGTKEWLRWELTVQRTISSDSREQETERPAGNANTLTRRCVSGVTLREVLNDARYFSDQKFAAIGWAAESLDQLSRCRADWGRGLVQSVSHGDATVNNVIVNISTKKAVWIDFDTRHLVHLSELDRKADDLRTFIFSVAVYLPRSSYRRLAAITFASLKDQTLKDRFRERLENEWRQLNTFQLAQTPLSWKSTNLLTMALLSSDRPFTLAATAVEAD